MYIYVPFLYFHFDLFFFFFFFAFSVSFAPGIILNFSGNFYDRHDCIAQETTQNMEREHFFFTTLNFMFSRIIFIFKK